MDGSEREGTAAGAGKVRSDRPPPIEGRLSRRIFIAGTAGLAAALAGLPEALRRKGLLEEAAAADLNLVRDTLNGAVSLIAPGNDEYSVAQGRSTDRPGGVAAGAADALIDGLDAYIPVPITVGDTQLTVPASGGVAALLNVYALGVNPLAAEGAFVSPMARLVFEDKAEVFRRFEGDPLLNGTEFRFVAGILPAFIGFLAFSEAGVLDPATGELSARPVGWQLSGFKGVRDGWPEHRGYYKGRRSARGASRFVRPPREGRG